MFGKLRVWTWHCILNLISINFSKYASLYSGLQMKMESDKVSDTKELV